MAEQERGESYTRTTGKGEYNYGEGDGPDENGVDDNYGSETVNLAARDETVDSDDVEAPDEGDSPDIEPGAMVTAELFTGEEMDGVVLTRDGAEVNVAMGKKIVTVSKRDINEVSEPTSEFGVGNTADLPESEWITRRPAPDDSVTATAYADKLDEFAEANGVAVGSKDVDVEEVVHEDVVRDAPESRVEERTGNRMGSLGDLEPAEYEFSTPGGEFGRRVKSVETENCGTVYAGAHGESTTMNLAERERAGYRFLETAGVSVPRHEFGGENNWRVKEEFEGTEVKNIRGGHSQTDNEATKDLLAMHIMGGDWDVHEFNIKTNEDGEIRSIDIDRMCDDLSAAGYEAGRVDGSDSSANWDEAFEKAGETYRRINGSITKSEASDELHNHARNLARSLVESGEHRRLIEAAAQESDRAAKHIAKNITALATETDMHTNGP